MSKVETAANLMSTPELPLVNPFEEVIGYLVAAMRSGELPVGTRLPPERELSERLKVSRATLRNVIRSLQQAGYVRTLRGRHGGSVVLWDAERDSLRPGNRLSPAMKDRLAAALKFRSVLEPGAARLAADNTLTREQEGHLRVLLGSTASPHHQNARLADAELHSYIAELSDCIPLEDAIGNVQLLLNDLLFQILPVFDPAVQNSGDQHSRIIEAIIAGDPDTAGSIMFRHVEATRELVQGFIR